MGPSNMGNPVLHKTWQSCMEAILNNFFTQPTMNIATLGSDPNPQDVTVREVSRSRIKFCVDMLCRNFWHEWIDWLYDESNLGGNSGLLISSFQVVYEGWILNDADSQYVLGNFIDFNAAFDHLEWSAIIKRLQNVGCQQLTIWRHYFSGRTAKAMSSTGSVDMEM